MKKVALITDSTCDLPKAIVERYNINIIPLHVVYKDREFSDGIDITPEEVYNSLHREIPKTSLPSVGKTLELFRKLKEEGYRDILAIHISSGLSGTYSMVRNLEEKAHQLGLSLQVVDSKSLSMGLGFLVIKAGQLIEKNTPLHDIVKTINRLREETKTFFVLKTLEYLRKGGRIGLVEGTIGEVFRIKPIISINKEGIYYTIAKSRGRKGSLKKLVEIVKNAIGKRKVDIAVMHGASPGEAKEMIQRIKKEINVKEVFTGQIGPVMGVHTGPGLIGISFCPE